MSKHKSGARAAKSPSPWEIVCTLAVDAIIDEFEVEICCQRTDGVDRVFSTSMDWLRAERPSEYSFLQTLHFTSPKMQFYDKHLDNAAWYARHAMSQADTSRRLADIQREQNIWGHVPTHAAFLSLIFKLEIVGDNFWDFEAGPRPVQGCHKALRHTLFKILSRSILAAKSANN
jgi:hypothetical protein